MEKTLERGLIESCILEKAIIAQDTAFDMLHVEFGDDMEAALNDEDFVARMQESISSIWKEYRQGFSSLEALDAKEGYQAVMEYSRVLDEVSKLLPERCLEKGYYPFSGIDLYWAKIFREITFQDIGFDGEKTKNLWWNLDDYSSANRQRILKILSDKIGIAPETKINFIGGDVQKEESLKRFNDISTTLIIKGGHSFIPEVRFIKPEFGAIILVDPADNPDDILAVLKPSSYTRVTPSDGMFGTDWTTPYSMSINKIHVYVKNRYFLV